MLLITLEGGVALSEDRIRAAHGPLASQVQVVGDLTKVYSTNPNSQSESSCLFRKFPNKDLVVWKKVVLLIRQSVRNFPSPSNSNVFLGRTKV